jgi:hypothetical protein
MKICRDRHLVKIGQKHRALYMKAYVHFIIVGDIKSPKKCSLLVKWHQVVRVAEEVQTSYKHGTMLCYMYNV